MARAADARVAFVTSSATALFVVRRPTSTRVGAVTGQNLRILSETDMRFWAEKAEAEMPP